MTLPVPRPLSRARDLTWVVALGAGLWATDALFRKLLVGTVAAPTLVFAEHLVLVIVTLPFLPRALRTLRRCSRSAKVAVVGIGVGASAVATTLFTYAFNISAKSYDFVTPVVVQHLQPLFAITGAMLLLRERIRARFLFFAVPALVGVWLLAFPQPWHVTVSGLSVALLALAAAALWAAGTVLGRMVAPQIDPVQLTTLRFAIGMPTAGVIAVLSGDPLWVPNLSSSGAVIGLALVPSLLALVVYYLGLRRTAAARATLAELAYPLVGAVVGILLGTHLTGSQWAGVVVVAAAVTGLSWHEATARTQAVVARHPEITTREHVPS
ncbi:DMT family transporter [Nakamurella endophytica]|uniref:EamA domain-containing protein n=1 Tax=Nakamurella endophytica TaxID=1748367 RepID=A0A917T7U7_9ACTN|nr:EamA family transporter [Nakamurella endophytica]GGM12880.1 hypothetical protein GCM10011594_36010 [Nakamurella endophytica]